MSGTTVATTLNSQATPVPIAMSVNMLSFMVRTEVHPRWKNGQPAHRTTGVARTSWTQVEAVAEMTRCNAGNRSPPIPRMRTGMVSATPTQNRRVMSLSSALGPVSAGTMTGSSAIPQIGQEPGPGCRISGCIGQVYSTVSPPDTEAAGGGAFVASTYSCGLASNFVLQCPAQK